MTGPVVHPPMRATHCIAAQIYAVTLYPTLLTSGSKTSAPRLRLGRQGMRTGGDLQFAWPNDRVHHADRVGREGVNTLLVSGSELVQEGR